MADTKFIIDRKRGDDLCLCTIKNVLVPRTG